jgi:hypothetical protein
MSDIKPCPFCRSIHVAAVKGAHFKSRFALCGECGAQGPEIRINVLDPDHEAKGEAEAMTEWNTRDDLAYLEEVIARRNERIAQLEARISQAKHTLELCRIWNGMGYDWHPIHARRAWEALQENGNE